MKPGHFGVSIYYGANPMKKPCVDCPFVMSDRGEDYLQEDRLDAIKFSVSMGQMFSCHKTVFCKNTKLDEEGNPPSYDRKYQQCAGAIAYAENLKKEIEDGGN